MSLLSPETQSGLCTLRIKGTCLPSKDVAISVHGEDFDMFGIVIHGQVDRIHDVLPNVTAQHSVDPFLKVRVMLDMCLQKHLPTSLCEGEPSGTTSLVQCHAVIQTARV